MGRILPVGLPFESTLGIGTPFAFSNSKLFRPKRPFNERSFCGASSANCSRSSRTVSELDERPFCLITRQARSRLSSFRTALMRSEGSPMGPVSSPYPSDGVLASAAVPVGPCRTIEVPTFAVASPKQVRLDPTVIPPAKLPARASPIRRREAPQPARAELARFCMSDASSPPPRKPSVFGRFGKRGDAIASGPRPPFRIMPLAA